MDVDEFHYEAMYQISRATRLAWTRKFDENRNEGWSDEDGDLRFERLSMFCVETISMSTGPDWLDRPERRRLRRCISAGGAAAERPRRALHI